MSTRRRLDVVPLVAALLAIAMAVVYVGVMRQEDDQPAPWVLAILVVGAALAGYGARPAAAHARAALTAAGIVLGVLGVLGILSIGLPILAAAALCFVGAARNRPAATT